MRSAETVRRALRGRKSGPNGDERASLFGLQVDPLTMSQVLERCNLTVEERGRLRIGVINAAKVVAASKNEDLRSALQNCDLLVADGQSVVWASRILGQPLPERVAGIDLFHDLLVQANNRGRSVYLLGATPEVLELLCTHIHRSFPNVLIAGHHDGYFLDEEAPAIAQSINESGSDMLFLGMTSPKKELFLDTFGDTLNVPIIHGVGGSFDVLAGVTKRAPLLLQKAGLEWAYRVVQEPRRLWRRYLTGNLEFALLVIKSLSSERTGA